MNDPNTQQTAGVKEAEQILEGAEQAGAPQPEAEQMTPEKVAAMAEASADKDEDRAAAVAQQIEAMTKPQAQQPVAESQTAEEVTGDNPADEGNEIIQLGHKKLPADQVTS